MIRYGRRPSARVRCLVVAARAKPSTRSLRKAGPRLRTTYYVWKGPGKVNARIVDSRTGTEVRGTGTTAALARATLEGDE